MNVTTLISTIFEAAHIALHPETLDAIKPILDSYRFDLSTEEIDKQTDLV